MHHTRGVRRVANYRVYKFSKFKFIRARILAKNKNLETPPATARTRHPTTHTAAPPPGPRLTVTSLGHRDPAATRAAPPRVFCRLLKPFFAMFFARPSADNQLAVAVAEVRLVGVEEGAQRSDVRGVRGLHFG